MTTRQFDADTIAELDRLTRQGLSVLDKIGRAQEHLDDLYEKRKSVFLAMLELGESKAGIARRFGYKSPMTVTFGIEGRGGRRRDGDAAAE